MNPAWVTAACALVTLTGILLAWLGHTLWRALTRFIRFMDEFFGRPAEGTKKAVPGVIERLERLESGVAGISEQVNLNSGHSLRDTVQRTEQKVENLQKNLTQLTRTVDKLGGGR